MKWQLSARVAGITMLACFCDVFGSAMCRSLVKIASGVRGVAPLIAADPQGLFTAVASPVRNHPVRIFRLPPVQSRLLDELRAVNETLSSEGGQVSSLALSRFSKGSQQLLAVGHEDGTVVVYDPQTMAKLYSLTRHSGPIRHLVYASPGLLVTVCQDRVHLWRGRRPLRTLVRSLDSHAAHLAPVAGVRVSREGNMLISFGEDGSVMHWRLNHQVERPEEHRLMLGRPLEGNSEPITATVLDEKGENLWAGTRDGNIISWQITPSHQGTSQPIRYESRDRTANAVTALEISLNGRFLLAGYQNGDIRIRDLRNRGRVFAVSSVPEAGAISKVVFVQSGRGILTTHADGVMRAWRVPALPSSQLPAKRMLRPNVAANTSRRPLPLAEQTGRLSLQPLEPLAQAETGVTEMQIMRFGNFVTAHEDGSVLYGSLSEIPSE